MTRSLTLGEIISAAASKAWTIVGIITQDCCFETSGGGETANGQGQQWADRSFFEAT